jgi:hypothetical protein
VNRRRREIAALVTLVALAAGCGGSDQEASVPAATSSTVDVPRNAPDAVDLPHPRGAKIGHWRWAALSPDGTTYLAQWSAECEVPFAFLVPAGGGEPEVVTGEADWTQAPESEALGWTTDGEPIARLPKGACGTPAQDPGTYVFGDGEPRRVDGGLEPSLEARDL